MDERTKKLELRLGEVFDRFQHFDDPKENARQKKNFIFHMMDWLDDARKFAQFVDNPQTISGDECADAVTGMVVHATDHLVAARRLSFDHPAHDMFQKLETGLSWFSANLLFERPQRTGSAASAPIPDGDELWEERVFLLQAKSDKEAIDLAEEIGKREEIEHDNSQREQGEWVFRYVDHITELDADVIEDGMEVSRRRVGHEEAKSLRQMQD